MVCSDFQTECLRVVTIGYLKSFIGSEVHSSVDDTPLYVNYSGDTYCPTYSELTGGTFIQTWQEGSTPNGDRDGIVINATWAGGSSGYSANQLVDQRDLSMKYTRFLSFTVSSDAGDIGQCGGDKNVSYVHQYTRYNKFMNTSCVIDTTSDVADDSANEEVNWTGCDWISVNQSSLVASAARQPETRTAPSRCCGVIGQIIFRSAAHSDTTNICQEALNGYWVLSGRAYTNITVTASTTSPIDCNGGDFSLTGTGYFYDRYYWKDNCNTEYLTEPFDDRSGDEDAGTTSGSFPECDCCEQECNDSITLTLDYHGIFGSYTFTQNCPLCPDDPECGGGCEGISYAITPNTQVGASGGDVTFTATLQ